MSNVVEWEELLPMVEEAFDIWVDYPERHWAKKAWAHLAKAGLADADTPVERVRVYVRFLVLASLYRDWCVEVWDEASDDLPSVWLSFAEVNPFHLGQLVGPDVDIEDPEDGLDDVLLNLMRRSVKRFWTPC